MFNLYTLFPSNFDAPSAGYPYGTPRNSTVAGAKDGSPWQMELVKDIFGALWATLDEASITPDGTAEAVNDSQFVDALKLIALAKINADYYRWEIKSAADIYTALMAYSPAQSGWMLERAYYGTFLRPSGAAASNLCVPIPYEQNSISPPVGLIQVRGVIDVATAALADGLRPQMRVVHTTWASDGSSTTTTGSWVEWPASIYAGNISLDISSFTQGQSGVFSVEIDSRSLYGTGFLVRCVEAFVR